jgi:monoterpene epsilon-lactone hydrolase
MISVRTLLVFALASAGSASAQKMTWTPIDKDGTVHVEKWDVPFSDLASKELRDDFVARRGEEGSRWFKEAQKLAATDPKAAIEIVDRHMVDAVEHIRKLLPYDRTEVTLGGVKAAVLTPLGGPPLDKADRVLISMGAAGGMSGELSGVPMVNPGGFTVVAPYFRRDAQFPAVGEDVEAVYRALLRQRPAGNVGIFGCSTGADLSAEAVAWFHKQGLPTPGAIGMYGSGAAIGDHWGDANYFASPLMGWGSPGLQPVEKGVVGNPSVDPRDPLVTPAYSRTTLALFPPALLLTGTRDIGLSVTVFTHQEMVAAGAEAELHVWEGADHCFASPGNPNVPETREAWDVMRRFFDKHLGHAPPTGAATSTQKGNLQERESDGAIETFEYSDQNGGRRGPLYFGPIIWRSRRRSEHIALVPLQHAHPHCFLPQFRRKCIGRVFRPVVQGSWLSVSVHHRS